MYFRKGSKGLSIAKYGYRYVYNYYRKRALEQMAYSRAFKEAMGIMQGKPTTLFKPQTFDELFEEGITRKVGERTVRIRGLKAIEVKLESLKNESDRNKKAEIFINNYLTAMDKTGYNAYDREEVGKLLTTISIDRLTMLIHGEDPIRLPRIQYIYAEGLQGDIVAKVKKAIKLSKSPQGQAELERYQKYARTVKQIEKEKIKLLGDLY